MLTGEVAAPAVKPVTDAWGFFGNNGMMAGGIVTFVPGRARFISFSAHFSDAQRRLDSTLRCTSWTSCAWNGGEIRNLSQDLRFSSRIGNSKWFYVGYATASGDALAVRSELSAFHFSGGQTGASFVRYLSDCPAQCLASGTAYVQRGAPASIELFFLQIPPLAAVAIFACGALLLGALYVRLSMPKPYAGSRD